MKRMMTTVMALCLGLVLLLPQQASAQRWLLRVADKLNLTEAQQTKIKTLVYNMQRDNIRAKAALQLARLDLKQLLDQHRPDLKKVKAAAEKVGKLEVQRKTSRILMFVKIKAVLTAQQAKQ